VNFSRGRIREEPEINLIPMIDVLLVILIFLMITTTYSKFAELRINLPQAQGEKAGDGASAVEIAVDAEGRYVVNGVLTSFVRVEALSAEIKRAAGNKPDPVIVISADAAATHQAVVNVMEAARLAGFVHITFTAQARQGSSQ
jgi:biopolymer transport protein ExbD